MRNFCVGCLVILLSAAFAVHAQAEETQNHGGTGGRFGIWAGAGTGILISDNSYLPYRLNVGAEIYFGSKRRLAVGYNFVAPLSSSSQPFRIIHYFPGIRYFIISDTLSLRMSPGISMQGMGMMGQSNASQNLWASVGFLTSVEYRIEVEPSFFVGIEAAYDYLSKVSDASLPKVSVWTTNINFSYRFGMTSHGNMMGKMDEK